MARRKAPAIPDDFLDQLLAGDDAAAGLNSGDLVNALKKALAERALSAEMDYHLSDEAEGENSHNGYGRKSASTGTGKIEIAIPRDRAGSFDPQLIAKYQRRFPGFDDKITSMYARGMSTREIAEHLREIYGMDAAAELISTITDAVLDEVTSWPQRPLDPVYPLVFFDAIRMKIRDEGVIRNKAIHIALGIMADGTKVVLGIWIEQNEGAKFWLRVMNELKNRGVEDILLAVVDGLKGFPEAITAVFPETIVQTCIVHLLRNSMDFVSYKDRKVVATALKDIYRAVDARPAEATARLLYLILNRSKKEWVMPPREWAMAKAQFAVIFGDHFVRAPGGLMFHRQPYTEFLIPPRPGAADVTRCLAGLDRFLLRVRVPLLRRRHQRRIDDLARHRDV
ncbi:IS256 family transposase [Acidiphilium sp. C61]|uniref:IS256 family transposase n=1 Tax=Acidiphilium sp. C61 TaxID=1671485 RepID=UPI001F007DEE|nr:IS256 family transposase [Acidiphilium sp. C61]